MLNPPMSSFPKILTSTFISYLLLLLAVAIKAHDNFLHPMEPLTQLIGSIPPPTAVPQTQVVSNIPPPPAEPQTQVVSNIPPPPAEPQTQFVGNVLPPPAQTQTQLFIPHSHATEIEEFLAAHNKIRQSMGEPCLTWDETLAKFAHHWAETLAAECTMVHSTVSYGENLFWGAQDHWTPAEAVQSWIKESDFFDNTTNHCKEGQMCEHYTQVIWKKTGKVGCARKKCHRGGLIVVCNYDPPGNYENVNPLDDKFM
ncbi:pathogenesis-related protein 1A-like [Mangifera indica]|uniref:pathogenesis-related protein 1A-like n=1 Tax=Mangifera indica TaxID=29780 RepID=UPI001CFAC9C7|nr:pathogenesis-related protein 1A-like [Mangifera indica]